MSPNLRHNFPAEHCSSQKPPVKNESLKLRKVYISTLNMLKLFGDSKNHRGGTDAKFIQEEQKQNSKLIKINYFQFKKQFIAVI